MSAITPSILNISTPEGVTFSLPLAGPVTRAVAMLVDFAVGLAINKIMSQVISAISFVSMDAGAATGILMQFVVMFGYATICELLFNGQTIGKRLLSIRVMDERGLRLRPGQVLIRNLLRFVDVLPYAYAVGGIFSVLSPRNQRLGDLAAGTIVVRTERFEPPAIDDVLGGKYNSFRAHPHLQARLRQKIAPAEVQYALSALLRNESLSTEARLKIYSDMADHFRKLVTFPEETTFGLTDEQYVRNVVDTVYHRDKPVFQR